MSVHLQIINKIQMNLEELNILLFNQSISINNLLNLEINIKTLLKFDKLSIEILSKKINKYGINGNLTRKEYNLFFKEIIKNNKIKYNLIEKKKIEDFINYIFIELNYNGIINYKPLVCGLSLLLEDDINKKTEFIYHLYYSLCSPNFKKKDINILLYGFFTVFNLLKSNNKKIDIKNVILNILDFYKNTDDTITSDKFKMLIYNLFLIYGNFELF